MISTDPAMDGASRQRILDAAIQLIADKGVDKVTLRELTARAGVNLGAVSYHFGNKDGLVETIFDTLSDNINQRRISELRAALTAAEQDCAAASVEALVGIFIRPYLEEEATGEGALLARLILLHRLSPTRLTDRIIRKHFDPMAEEFIRAFARACPQVASEEYYWRYHFMVNTVVLMVTDRSAENRVARLSSGAADASDRERLRAALMRYIVGGMRAPD